MREGGRRMIDSPRYRNALELNTRLAEYQLDAVLGIGGFGITYRGWDRNLEKHVAIKEYLPGDLALRALDGSVVPVSTDHQYDYRWGLDGFLQEARTLARFSHPNIVRVNRYFEANGTAYMVMDYEQGESFNQRLQRPPAPDESELMRILLPLLDGLAAVHSENFMHRDIKPSNLFIRNNGQPVLLDFGAARMIGSSAARSRVSVLTPGYAPIESYMMNGRQGPWTDIYALGGVLFRAMTGGNPPDAPSRLQHDTVPAALASRRKRYSDRLLQAVAWALAGPVEERPQTVADWQAALTAPHAARHGTRLPPDSSAAWRQVGWTALLLIIVMLALAWFQRHPRLLTAAVMDSSVTAAASRPPQA